MTTEQKIIKTKVGVLELAKQLDLLLDKHMLSEGLRKKV